MQRPGNINTRIKLNSHAEIAAFTDNNLDANLKRRLSGRHSLKTSPCCPSTLQPRRWRVEYADQALPSQRRRACAGGWLEQHYLYDPVYGPRLRKWPSGETQWDFRIQPDFNTRIIVYIQIKVIDRDLGWNSPACCIHICCCPSN